MSRKKKRIKILKRGTKILRKPVYLNANMIYSQIISELRKKPSSTLKKLKENGFQLVTSILTRFEIIQNLINSHSMSLAKARQIYLNALNNHEILEITALNTFNLLTDVDFEQITSSNLALKDALHLLIAKKNKNLIVCTHDKKMKKSSTHLQKQKFYPYVFKPEELIKSKK